MADKRNTILHIGYPKTGSTWLQKRFFPKVENIVFFRHNDIPWNIISPDLIKDEILEIKKYFQDNEKRIVLSDEGLIGRNKTMEQNAGRLKEIFEEAEIIIFFRNQIDKYASNYSQYIKAGCTCSVDDYLFPYGYNKEPYGSKKHSYDRLFDIYKELFGREHVHGYLFEEFIDEPEFFIKKFTDKFNLDVDIKRISFMPKNQRLSLAGIKLNRFCNCFTRNCAYNYKKNKYLKKYYFHIPYWYKISFYIFKLMQSIGIFCGKSSYKEILGKDNVKRLTSYFKTTNKRLIENHGFNTIVKYNYPL